VAGTQPQLPRPTPGSRPTRTAIRSRARPRRLAIRTEAAEARPTSPPRARWRRRRPWISRWVAS